MTDNEIIKVFEYCILDDEFNGCHNCSAYQDDKCTIPNLGQELLQIFDRQRAEIERLNAKIKAKDEINYYNMGQLKVARDDIKTAKSEAIKEFAERLKESMRLEDDCKYDCEHCFYDCNKYVSTIDNLVKEMTEAEK